ncbi:hypothetical protein BH23CHL2_BH23CHL2_17480 [soil metagenome]
MYRLQRRLLAVLLTVVLLLPASVSSQPGGGVSPDGEITTGADHARQKIHEDLAEELESAPANQEIWFVGHAETGVDLSPYIDRWFSRPDFGLGVVAIVGYATPTEMIKVASDVRVLQLQLPKSIVDPPQPIDSDVSDALNANITPSINMEGGPGPAPEGWAHTGTAIHGSQDAWAKGFTGQGVIHMSNDSGADYCHPDLHGTWAYNMDLASPYYGLPMMYDSFSSLLLANDFYLGTNFVGNGQTDYADTSATTTGPTFGFAPIGANSGHTFTTTGTSLSGLYHYGSHPDNTLAANAAILRGAFGNGAANAGQRAGVLVVDENTPGVYDMVYVDTNYNFDFSDDMPASLTRDFTYQETSCLDYNNDGLNDVSGGLVYYIADGATSIPTTDWLWDIPAIHGPGDLVAFHVMDAFGSPGGNHGMGTTSVATGQGVVSGSVFWGPGGPPQANGQGLVVGPGKDAKSTQNGDFYASAFIEDATLYATLGYDGIPVSGDETQIISDSWGSSGVDNDGWDFSSQLIDLVNRVLGPYTVQLFSTGNGAAGYGTTSPPSPSSGISVGASTLFGSIGLFEMIGSENQIVGGDPMSWSNRGPGAVPGHTGVDIVATGAFGTGDIALNQVLDGSIATANFGGTSMAAPVAAGNLALIYQAWKDRTGMFPTFDEAKSLIMSSASNTDHDVWSQGAGLVNADYGTDIAFGNGGSWVAPSEWAVGDYQGAEYPAFGQIIAPGQSDTQTFTFNNAGGSSESITVRPVQLTKIGSSDYSFTSHSQSLDHGSFTTPDYAWRIDQNVPQGTDMVMVRVTIPYDQFDPDGDLNPPYNSWRVHLQNWTDLDSDGQFWVDANGNGKVDIGEMDANEHIRFTYGYNAGPTQQARISNPLDRIDDGLLLTFRHSAKNPAVPTTDLTVEVSYWQWSPWNWVNVGTSRGGSPFTQVYVPSGGMANLNATINIPNGTPYGMYQGGLLVQGSVNTQMIPINVAVAAQDTQFNFGGNAPVNTLYDNGHMFGYTDYFWRAESGDWRFFWADISADDLQVPRDVFGFPTGGTPYLVVDNQWSGQGADIDTLIYGPSVGPFNPSGVFGPYTLNLAGGSSNLYQGSGRWGYQTSSGGPREIVAAVIEPGLNGIFLHQVKVDGGMLNEPLHGNIGMVNVAPGVVQGADATGSQTISLYSELPFSGLQATGYGVSAPMTTTETIFQDDPNDPSTASFSTNVTMNNGAELTVATCCTANGSDIDLFVYGPSGSLLASSTTPTDQEFVTIQFPADGTYRIDVHGWSVVGGVDTFDLTINAVQGSDIVAVADPGPVSPGGVKKVKVSWNLTGKPAGVYQGVVLIGPPDAPGLIAVPVEITLTASGGGGGKRP